VTICLAVLASFGLAIAFLAELGRSHGWSLPPVASMSAASWPRPPPLLAPSLSKLSILRI
jgi:hypothetical protein